VFEKDDIFRFKKGVARSNTFRFETRSSEIMKIFGAMPKEINMSVTIVRGRSVVEEKPWLMSYIRLYDYYEAEIVVSRSFPWDRVANFSCLNNNDRIYLFTDKGEELGWAGFKHWWEMRFPWYHKFPAHGYILPDLVGCDNRIELLVAAHKIDLIDFNDLLNSLDDRAYEAVFALHIAPDDSPKKYILYRPPKKYKSFEHWRDSMFEEKEQRIVQVDKEDLSAIRTFFQEE